MLLCERVNYLAATAGHALLLYIICTYVPRYHSSPRLYSIWSTTAFHIVAVFFQQSINDMITPQHAKRLALDTLNLSSLFLRHVLLTRPVTLDAYRVKARELLVNQSRLADSAAGSTTLSGDSNLVAIKLLQFAKEWNLMQYYGLQEYGRRWWGSRSNLPMTNNNLDAKKTAQIAFMITKDQRRSLGKLGYSAEDIRSFKPIEALLLVKNSVSKECDKAGYDFRVTLKELVHENDKLMKVHQLKEVETVRDIEQYVPPLSKKQSLSPEEVQRAHVKPDVAQALLNVDEIEKQNMIITNNNQSSNEDELVAASTFTRSSQDQPIASTNTNVEPVIRPVDSEKMHMKPDVAAAYLSSHRQTDESNQQKTAVVDEDEKETTDPCWYEVVEVGGSAGNKEQIIALFSTKKEAIECASIKESFRARGNQNQETTSNIIVRRRWNL